MVDIKRSMASPKSWIRALLTQLWIHLLLRLPVLYFIRVARVLEDANLTVIDFRILQTSRTPSSGRFSDFERRWNGFIDSLKAEWQAQGIVSALLLPYVTGSTRHCPSSIEGCPD